MSNGFLQASNFDQLSDLQQGMPNRFLVYPANYLIEKQNRISSLSERMLLSQAASVAAAMQARQQAVGIGRRRSPNFAATTHRNPNSSSARRSSDYNIQMLHVRPESITHKPQLQNIYNNNNHHHADSAAVYRSQNQNHQSQNQSGYDDVAARKYAQDLARAWAHYQFAMLQRKREHAFRLLVSSMAPPSSTYSTMLMNAQPATALTMGLSGGNLYQQQQEVGNDNSNPVVHPPNNPSCRALREINMNDGADQEDELDLSLKL